MATDVSRSDLTIACVQFQPTIGEVEANLVAMDKAIRTAHAAGANLVVLPELSDSGYVFMSEEERAGLASPIPEGESSRRLIALARELGIYIVSGLAERDADSFYNSSIICGPDGYIGKYRKLHLWNREKLFFEPGNLGLPVFATPVGKIGILICYDGWFPEAFRQLALNGAELICVPTNWVPMPGHDKSAPPMANILHMAAAHSNAIFIACADRVGTERGQEFIGSSLIVGPTGWPIAGPANHDDEAIVVATVSLDSLAASRIVSERNDVVGDRRPDVYS